jgi:hypothetical protein
MGQITLDDTESAFRKLESITPYEGDYREVINEDGIENQITELCREIDGTDIRSVPFDKWDLAAIFFLGITEVAADFLMGDPHKGISRKMSDKESRIGRKFNWVHENLDHKNNPLDYQGAIEGVSFGGGDHRARTYGHDLFFFPQAIYQMCAGRFMDGGYVNGSYQKVHSILNAAGNAYESLPIVEAVVAYAIHMLADFFSSKGLPVPGFVGLAHLPNREIRKIVADMYSDGFNLRHVLASNTSALLPTEILVRGYIHVRYKDSTYPKTASILKRDKMLLLIHSTATAVNLGKVIITKNPALINLPMILRAMQLVWSVARDDSRLTNKAIVKTQMSSIRSKLETARTLILLDKSVYYTKEIDRIILQTMQDHDTNRSRNRAAEISGFEEIQIMLDGLKQINDQYNGASHE